MLDTNKRCKHIKREGESCRLNNNCTYPDCEIETFNNKREMTPKEVAQKHYQDHQFDECKLHCMRCDDEWCESQVIAIISLEADIIQCIETFKTKEK